MCSLSTTPRDTVSYQALGELRVLPLGRASLCEETGQAEPPTERERENQHAVSVGVCLCVCMCGGMQCLHSKILVKVGSRGWGRGVSLPTLFPGPCGQAGCGLDPFTSPNVIILLGEGWGRGSQVGPCPLWANRCLARRWDSLALQGPTMGAGSESGLAQARPH